MTAPVRDRYGEVQADLIARLLDAEREVITAILPYHLAGTESPIEELFALGLMAETWLMRDHYRVQTQAEIDTYRVDFLVEYRDQPISETFSRVVVECDGHDYHERTKQQAKRDKSRDRRLSALGYTVVRFTGSEIWADPFACAKEACGLASTLFYERAVNQGGR